MVPAPNTLQVHCSKCEVSAHCPAKGASPLRVPGSRSILLCRIAGGYGRIPPREEAVSEKSRALQIEHGPCLTVADVPRVDAASGKAYMEVVKIWHPPLVHPRSVTTEIMDMMYPRSHR